MRIERTVSNYNEVGYLVDFKYESYKEMAECIANYMGWDDYDYEDFSHESIYNSYYTLSVWKYDSDDDDDTVTVSIENEEEEE